MIRILVCCLSVALVAGCRPRAQDWGNVPEVDRSPSDDWAFEPSGAAFERFDSGRSDFSCAKLGEYLASNDPWAAVYAIRDAGLFLDKGCLKAIETCEEALLRNATTAAAVEFYRARLGDNDGVEALVAMFDKGAMESAKGPSVDHVVVSLFGFLPDWDRTGRRLLRHAKYADGAAATLNAYALVWKKHLYGDDPNYATSCARAAELEDVASMEGYFCNPPMTDP